MLISVIVPCRNERQHVRDFLDSVLAQTLDPGWEIEVLIADGESNDGTREILEDYARRAGAVRVVDNPGRIVSTGLNRALAEARGEVIVRLDVHTTYAPDYVRECVRSLKESGADNVGGPVVAKGHGLWGQTIAAAYRSRFCCGGGRAHDPAYEGEVDTVHLGCWPRAIFDRIGQFDERLVRNQDDEFNFRLLRSGGKIWQSPRIRSSYVVRSSLKRLFQQYLQYGFWKVAVIRKHRGLASWRHIVPALFVASLLLLPLAIAGSWLAHFGSAALGFATVFFCELLLYAIASVTAAAGYARELPRRALVLLPAVFAVYHVAHGLGFLMGIVALRKRERGVQRKEALFSALTR